MGVYNRKEGKQRPPTSLQTREKMSKTRKGNHLNPKEFKKGHIAWNKNKSPSLITRIKMSESGKRKVFSETHRRNMSKASRGKPKSEKHRKNISLNHKHGKPQLGKKHSEETKNKMSNSQKGEKGNNWKGGITPENIKIRNSIESEIWRNAVFARDGYTCQKTGTKGDNLRAHHIKNFSNYPELRFAIDNGITLSDKAHKEFHKKYGRKNNTREQLEEFLKKLGTIV